MGAYSVSRRAMASLFTKIINREIPAHFVYKDELCVVILDKFPTVKGQTLVIPKKNEDYVFELEDESYTHIMRIAKKIARASDHAFGTSRTCMVIEGFEVPHVHLKLYPMMKGDTDLASKLMGGAESDDETLAIIATQLQGAIEEVDE